MQGRWFTEQNGSDRQFLAECSSSITHQPMIENQHRQGNGTENGRKSNVQNLEDKYNIYN